MDQFIGIKEFEKSWVNRQLKKFAWNFSATEHKHTD